MAEVRVGRVAPHVHSVVPLRRPGRDQGVGPGQWSGAGWVGAGREKHPLHPAPSLSLGWERPLWGWIVAAPPSAQSPPGSAQRQRGARRM